MKKILAIILSVVLVLSMSVTAFATEISGEGQVAQSTLSYTEPSTYTVIIPDTIYVSSGATLDFETSFLNIQETEQLVIKVNNLDENDMITLSHASGDTINVYFAVNNDADICYRVNADNTVAFAASLQTSYDGSILSAGDYTGIAEFTVSIAPKMD